MFSSEQSLQIEYSALLLRNVKKQKKQSLIKQQKNTKDLKPSVQGL